MHLQEILEMGDGFPWDNDNDLLPLDLVPLNNIDNDELWSISDSLLIDSDEAFDIINVSGDQEPALRPFSDEMRSPILVEHYSDTISNQYSATTFYSDDSVSSCHILEFDFDDASFASSISSEVDVFMVPLPSATRHTNTTTDATSKLKIPSILCHPQFDVESTTSGDHASSIYAAAATISTNATMDGCLTQMDDPKSFKEIYELHIAKALGAYSPDQKDDVQAKLKSICIPDKHGAYRTLLDLEISEAWHMYQDSRSCAHKKQQRPLALDAFHNSTTFDELKQRVLAVDDRLAPCFSGTAVGELKRLFGIKKYAHKFGVSRQDIDLFLADAAKFCNRKHAVAGRHETPVLF